MTAIALSPDVFAVSELLDRDACAELVHLAEAAGFGEAGVRSRQGQTPMPQVRNYERVVVEHAPWVARLWERLQVLRLPVLEGERAVGLPRSLRFYRYGPGQRFRMHKDGPWLEDGLKSRLTLLIYLNQSFVGGETRFRDFEVRPRTGDGLAFVHATWHEGAEVTQGRKYVLRTDVLYARACAQEGAFDCNDIINSTDP